MKILILGSGGREHALAWKLAQSPGVSSIFCAPGNPGISSHAELLALDPGDLRGIADAASREGIDLTVVGPEQPLADGVVDLFRERGLTIFGPTREASALEWSKAFAKGFMRRHSIPTAYFQKFGAELLVEAKRYIDSCSPPIVLKADGLAAGKGVLICNGKDEARDGLTRMMEEKAFGEAGATVVVEEYLEGVEASVFAVSDGERFVTLAPAQDYKRAFDDDRGMNTGGMGAYAPAPFVTQEVMETVRRKIITPTLEGMAAEGKPYAGCLYVGLMLTQDGPKVVEYNARFGDPETQVVLPLYDGNFAALLYGAAGGRIPDEALAPGLERPAGHAVCVVAAAEGYPGSYRKGVEIRGLDSLAGRGDIAVFHAGTAMQGGRLVTSGGRVLGVMAHVREGVLADAMKVAYEGLVGVSFDGMHFRRDIGRKGLTA
ncbi:MAG: phosphoribosylamine--glycine ligase [Bacteroidota bacterium]